MTKTRGLTAIRIIPCLDLKDGRVVKGIRFLDLEDSGDPAELAARYEAEGADELALLDISATLEGRATSLEALRRVRSRLSIPIAMGGGVRTEDDAARLLEAGADRVSVNSAAVREPELLSRLASRFGVQCVILAIDARRKKGGGSPRWELVIESGRLPVALDPIEWARRAARLGAGEILLTSMDRDGTGSGYDLGLIAAVAEASGLPVIASGGASRPGHFHEAAEAGARALLAAGSFHRGELSISDVKSHLALRGMEVRS